MNLLKCFRNHMTKRRACYKALQRLNSKGFCLRIFIFTSTSLSIRSFSLSSRIFFHLWVKAQLFYSVFYLHFISFGSIFLFISPLIYKLYQWLFLIVLEYLIWVTGFSLWTLLGNF